MTHLRALRDSEITYTFFCEDETISPVGNFLDTGDFEQDRADELEILKRREAGNPWEWCYIVCNASCGKYAGRAGIGACSYSSEESFLDDDDIVRDLQIQALTDLKRKMREAYRDIAPYLEG
jgi:hypothetical protein